MFKYIPITYEVLKWAMSEEGKEVIDGYKME